MRNSHSDSNTYPLTLLAGLALFGGGAAWILVAILVALSGPDQKAVPSAVPVVQQPTLAAVTPTDTPSPTASPTATLTATVTVSPAAQQAESLPTASPAVTVESTAGESGCIPPEGWERYSVQQDDTLFAFVLGADSAVSVEDIMTANCLQNRWLQVGQVLYLPPGAAENAPPSAPAAPAAASGVTGPRTPNCPCTITVAAGWRREQIADAITASQTAFTGADFLTVTGPGVSAPFDFTADRPAGTSLEGFLYPGTYTAQNDTTAEQFRDMLLEAFGANVNPQIRADAGAQGVSFYQALILASIVQREVRVPETQKLVASVYYNRLRDGNRLASTVPVQYALGGPGNWWPRVNGSNLEVESPYNTYTHAGLPPGPIDNPDLNAIVAVVYAPATNYYFHTASCDGSGEAFAATYEEHLANVNCE